MASWMREVEEREYSFGLHRKVQTKIEGRRQRMGGDQVGIADIPFRLISSRRFGNPISPACNSYD